jgi:LacI family transcriptional regulator
MEEHSNAPTMRDVARHAGVSTATVSHVINHTRPVSDELRERVHTSMELLGYQRNAIARALRSRQSHTIGVIVPDSSNPFFAEVAKGIEEGVLEQEYSLILCDSNNDLGRVLLHTKNLSAKQVDGIIYATSGEDFESIRSLLGDTVAVVAFDLDTPGFAADAVLWDNFRAGQTATQHLVDLGHRRIACITGPSRQSLRRERELGYRQVLTNAGIPVDDSLVREGDFQPMSGYRHALSLLQHPEDRPSAIFACNDLMAMGVLRAAHELGVIVPDDLSVIGFDGIYLTSFTTPTLSTIRLPRFDMGRQAAHLLLQRIRDTHKPAEKRIFEFELVARESTAPYRTNHR